MSDLQAELDAVLQAVEPGSPPAEAVMRRGRRIRLRRRVTAVAGTLAIAVAAAAGYPMLTQKAAPKAPGPTAPRPAGLTVTPGLGSPKGVIATGTIGSEHWQASVSDSRTREQCFTAAVGTGSLGSVCDLMPRPATVPAAWHIFSDGSHEALITGVAPDVTYIVVTTADRQQLKLIPVTAGYGDRFVGLVAPQDLNVTSMTAYLADGQEAPIAQFSPPGWTRPGTNSPPNAAASLGPVFVDGQQWVVSAEEGPWGTCISTGNGGHPGALSCTTAAPMTTLTAIGVASVPAGSPTIVYGSAQPTAASLTVTLTDGQSLHVQVRTVGTENLWAFGLGDGQAVKNWTAFSASGKPLGTGGLPGSTAAQP